MSPTERLTVGALISILAILVPGFVLHVAPRFPGSFAGSAIGVAGTILLVLLLVYSVAKRAAFIRTHLGQHLRLSVLLSWHVYCGVFAALLGTIHSGHKFYSPLGIALVATILIVVLTGFIGRYYLAHVGVDLREQQAQLGFLRSRYDVAVGASAATDAAISAVLTDISMPVLIGGIADLEYAIEARTALKRALSVWISLHIATAIVMYSLLALHVWNGFYYGFRWLE